MTKLLDLVELHQEQHQHTSLWMLRAGVNAGMTSMVFMPNCFAFVIKDSRLSSRRLEHMLRDYRAAGILVPEGEYRVIHGEQFKDLEVEFDEYNEPTAVCESRAQDHG